MSMKKRVAALCLAATLALSAGLSGCGTAQSNDPMSSSQTPLAQTVAAASAALPFTDVAAGAPYAPAVAWCYEKGILKGTSDTTFESDATLTRSMLATAIYRAAGEPAVSGNPSFTDTQAGTWYSDAVVWANAQSIIRGYGNGLFGTDDPVSVEQLQVILDRYLGRGDTWKGDPSLAVPATRSQVATALYENLKNTTSGSSKVLVAYFSATGNTEAVAEYIAGHLGADTYEIVPAEPYSSADLNYNNGSSRVSREHENSDLRPPISGELPDMSQYDTVFLGFPLWWGQAPHVILTFMDSVDLAEKTVIPFCTSASSPLGSSDTNLHDDAPDANWLPGQRFAGRASQDEVIEWVDTLGLNLAADTGKPIVYMTASITPEGLMDVYNALNWTPTGKVAVKLSTGEPPASNYLRPELIKDVVQTVDGTIVECNTAYGGQRASTALHYQVAKDHGFTDIADVKILDEDGSMALPVEGGSVLTENYVGAAFDDYDSYLVLSHFKGHAMAGFGGAIKNISIGLGSSEGKCWIHSGGTSRTSPWGGDQTAFTESMAEAGKSVVDALDGRIVYVNVMNRLSVDCDCSGNPAEPDLHDIGILASTDPVALDQACVDLIYAQKDGDGASLVRRIESRNGLHTLEHAEEIGLGQRAYSLVSIDN